MHSLRHISAITLLLSAFALAQSTSQTNAPIAAFNVSKPAAAQASDAQAKVADNYGKLPLAFEANHGQTDPQVKFLSRTAAYSLFLTGDEAVLTLNAKKSTKPSANWSTKPSANPISPQDAAQGFVSGHRFSAAASLSKSNAPSGADLTAHVLRMKLQNANSAAKVTGIDEQSAAINYFIGNDPAKWRTNVPTFARIKYENIYNGIDLVYYGNQRQLEYDFIVSPGANPRSIAFTITGANTIRQDAHGDLVFKMNAKIGDQEIRWHKPVVYQEKNGVREEIAAHYTITDKTRVGFELAKYDTAKPLYIDPLIYSTYLGGSGDDYGYAIALDSMGSAYLTGYTTSSDFPTMDPLQPANGGGEDAFVTKINAAGSALVYSTYLGGSGDDRAFAIVVDKAGNTFVSGYTTSTNFPTMNALQPTIHGSWDAYVTKLNPTGSALVYSTYLGGSSADVGNGIAVDSAGNAYVTGYTTSDDFPTANALQPTYGGAYADAFVAKFNPAGSALVYSTYLGGTGADEGYGIALDAAGNVYVTGVTGSTNFPTTPGAFQTVCNLGAGCNQLYDAFVSKINPSGSALAYSTYLGGGQEDWGNAIAVDSGGNAYVTGFTYSANFPIKSPLQSTNHGHGDAFVTKLNSAGSALVYSTFLGGKGTDYGLAVAVDSTSSAYVTGSTGSNNFPTKNAFQATLRGANNAFVTRISPSGSALVYSTYLGGSTGDGSSGVAVDSAGNAYVTGWTGSTDFPTMNPLQPANGGGIDAFVAKMYLPASTTTVLSSSENPSALGDLVTFTAVIGSVLGAPPDGETVMFMKGSTVLGTGALRGGSATFKISTLQVGIYAITAVYVGDSNFLTSKSKVVKQKVVSK
jgi:hypothetical protein